MKFEFGAHRISVNVPTRAALMEAMRNRFKAGEGFALATINLDHIVKLRSDSAFAAAYANQDLVVADGNPIQWLASVAGERIEVLPGSDLVVPICELAASMDVPVALVGSTEDALAGAAKALETRVPGLRVVLTIAPGGGFDPHGAEATDILDRLAASDARLCFLALGAPRQEVFAARGRAVAPAIGFASVGAGLDFLSGHQTRAPRLVRSLKLEWLWRALSSPLRLGPRYLRCIAILPSLFFEARRAK